jgi:hypothetical protein
MSVSTLFSTVEWGSAGPRRAVRFSLLRMGWSGDDRWKRNHESLWYHATLSSSTTSLDVESGDDAPADRSADLPVDVVFG